MNREDIHLEVKQLKHCGCQVNKYTIDGLKWLRMGFSVPARKDVKDDMAQNWTFFRAQYENYEIATGLEKRNLEYESLRLCG